MYVGFSVKHHLQILTKVCIFQEVLYQSIYPPFMVRVLIQIKLQYHIYKAQTLKSVAPSTPSRWTYTSHLCWENEPGRSCVSSSEVWAEVSSAGVLERRSERSSGSRQRELGVRSSLSAADTGSVMPFPNRHQLTEPRLRPAESLRLPARIKHIRTTTAGKTFWV